MNLGFECTRFNSLLVVALQLFEIQPMSEAICVLLREGHLKHTVSVSNPPSSHMQPPTDKVGSSIHANSSAASAASHFTSAAQLSKRMDAGG